MKGFGNQTYLFLYIISNVIALLMLWAAWKQPRIARLLFFLVFTWASWTNWKTALQNPQFYIEYADLSFLDIYKQFIRGWFSTHVTEVVGFIATCQALIAVSMLLKGWLLKLGAIGAIIFLMCIAPLGVGSAFPFSITASLALYFILKNGTKDYLWVSLK
ncbi:hypothetical protein A3860_26660 [Niastella vici]|uniref:DoxX family protein n=1 Tax=Niastella vici TaxID=1703345 RepID=A0A1V9FX49_9BACT|nr:hypothetical protein [Niastella vici]OQP62894.1 hypothetical protein A3860_26660 [Niastella vici]